MLQSFYTLFTPSHLAPISHKRTGNATDARETERDRGEEQAERSLTEREYESHLVRNI